MPETIILSEGWPVDDEPMQEITWAEYESSNDTAEDWGF